MGRGWKILLVVSASIAALLGVNALVTGAETKRAEAIEPGARIVDLPGGDLEVVESGPRDDSPIVLVHGFTGAIDWWDRVIPRLAERHRVIAVALLGHGGSEKPTSGYSIENQADLVAGVMGRLGVSGAAVVGHSLGGAVVTALAERSPALVERVVIVDEAPTSEHGGLGPLAWLALQPVIGDALWRVKPDFSVRKGLEVAFAPGFDLPDAFVEDVDRMTFSAYTGAHEALDEYRDEQGLDRRMRASGQPLLAIMGAEEQIVDDPAARLAEYAAAVPGAETELIEAAGHSPNVETPARASALILAFARDKAPANRRNSVSVQSPLSHESEMPGDETEAAGQASSGTGSPRALAPSTSAR